eukprot:8927071-Lingulodinium_polyedra.AAC.1
MEDASSSVASALKKGRNEASLKQCATTERGAFEQAKQKEIGEWLRSNALRAVARRGISEDLLMRS